MSTDLIASPDLWCYTLSEFVQTKTFPMLAICFDFEIDNPKNISTQQSCWCSCNLLIESDQVVIDFHRNWELFTSWSVLIQSELDGTWLLHMISTPNWWCVLASALLSNHFIECTMRNCVHSSEVSLVGFLLIFTISTGFVPKIIINSRWFSVQLKRNQ